MNIDFRDRTVIVTGAVRGIGRGIAAAFAERGARVYACDVLADELGPFGITVNSVAPGFMRTSPDYERQWNGYDAQHRQAVFQRIAMRRWGTPEDIAHAVLFFTSDFASWITGQTLAVKGAP